MKPKKPIKERLIEVLRTNVTKWNRYVRFSLSVDVEFSANLSSSNLSWADLSYANLRYANLSSANLSYADLSYANLSYANLRYANLRSANLSWADLSYANLSSADLDFSCLSLYCGSLKMKTDIKIRTQIGFHFASLIANCEDATEDERKIYADMLDYVNRFHRKDVARLNELPETKNEKA